MEPCSHRKVFSGKPNYQQPPRPHNFEWICSKCHAVGYQAQIVSGHEHPEDDDYVDQDLFAQLKPLAKYEMRTITVKEALELMFAGEVVSAAIVKPMIEGNIPPLHRFRIVDGVVFIFADKPIYKATFWEQYHCAINTFLGFDFFVPKAEETR